MNEHVQTMVTSYIDTINNFYIVPEEREEEYNAFVDNLNACGESCMSYEEFMEKFKEEGLEERFSSLMQSCTPKASYKKSDYLKGYSSKTFLKGFAKESVKSVIGIAATEAKSEIIARNKKARIEEGTDRDYNVASNHIHSAKKLASLLGNKFGKK